MSLLLGLDYGTTSFKVGLFDPAGAALAQSGGEVPVLAPAPGWVEQDMATGWRAVCGAIRRVLQASQSAARDIRAICATGTYNLTLSDSAGRLLRPAILYGDARVPPAEDLEVILRQLGESRVASAFGFAALDPARLTVILRVLRASKLLWLRANEPETFARIQSCLGASSDYISARLTGTVARQAGGLALDDEIAELFDLPADWFGRVHPVGDIVGAVTASASEETGLAEGTPVVMAAGDSICGVLGGGLTMAGMALNLGGTTDVVALATDHRPTAGYPVPHLIPGLWLASLSPVRGPAMRWARETLLPAQGSFADLDALAAQAPPGSAGLLCLPAFSGEKGVVHDPEARGALVGLHLGHDRSHIARAVLEGIAFGLREILESYTAAGLALTSVRLGGGGARSPLWAQIKADVLGQPVGVLQVPEAGCLGAAMLAAAAVGVHSDWRSAADAMARVARTYRPDPKANAVYQEAFQAYRELYPASREAFRLLARLAAQEQAHAS